MKDLKELVILSLSLAPIMVDINTNNAYGEMTKIRMPTDNGSTFVEVTIDKGSVTDNTLTIDAPQQVKFDIVFLHPERSTQLHM